MKRFNFSYKLDDEFYLYEELLEQLEGLCYEMDLDFNHGEEYQGSEAEEFLKPNESVVTGVYTIRIGHTDNLFSWLEIIGNRNLFESDSYGFIHNGELYHKLDKKYVKIEDKHPKYSLREHAKYKFIENTVLKHHPTPQPEDILTFFILEHSAHKKSMFKEPKLKVSGYSLEMFHKPKKPEGVYRNTPFTSFHNVYTTDVDKKWNMKTKDHFLNTQHEYVTIFEDIEVVDKFSVQEKIINIIDLIYGINDEDSYLHEIMNQEFENKKYIYNSEIELPDKIKNILINKLGMNYLDDYDPDDESKRFGITYHPLMRILGYYGDNGRGSFTELEIKYIE